MQDSKQNRSPPKHPWRGARLDGAGVRRSNRFSTYLQSLPPEERRRIEAAERAYVAKTEDANGFHATVARDFDESLQGVKENEPVEYRGFVT